ncbi:uncharacterized protein LOC141607988 [Silene latifolia]|uniref:uncharacterized protein LOC141607988 n=1 Tax=Silene latifolia TaxID=37657 RepID=UPI003D7762FD
MSSPPLLAKPEKDEPLLVYLSVSDTVVSAILVKEHEGQQHPVYYISKSLLDAEMSSGLLEKYVLAFIMSCAKLRPYFECHPIIVRTNLPVKSVVRKPKLSGRMAKWSVQLSTYDISFEPKTTIKSQALVDFVADFSPNLESDLAKEVNQLENKNLDQEWTIFIDEASNARGTGLGLVLKLPQGDTIAQAISYEFKATNNEAEYEALIVGLKVCLNLGVQNLKVKTDSLLIANQFKGTYAAKDAKMISYLVYIKTLTAKFPSFDIDQIPRDLNTQANALASLGSNLPLLFLIKYPLFIYLNPPSASLSK